MLVLVLENVLLIIMYRIDVGIIYFFLKQICNILQVLSNIMDGNIFLIDVL